MRMWRRWLILMGLIAVVLAAGYVGFAFKFMDFVIDLWWFKAVGYGSFFLQRLFYRYVISGCVILIFFLIFFFNFWIASRFLGTAVTDKPQNESAKRKYRNLLKMFQSGSMSVYTPLSLILAIFIAIPFYEKWEEALLYFFSPNAGVPDPVFGRDVGYYLFSLPIYTLIQSRLFVVALILSGSLFVLYWLESRLLAGKEEELHAGAKIHLTFLFLMAFLIQGWDYMLQRYSLLYVNTHQPLFYGPGFVEMRYSLPMIWLRMVLFAGMVISLVIYVHRRKGGKSFLICGLLFILAVGANKSTYVPNLIDKYFVKPNEVVRERSFIDASIKATLSAYNLQNVETRKYDISKDPMVIHDPKVQYNIRNIPVWDRELLVDVYKQLQEIRPYYLFPTVDVDRYAVKGLYQQVNLAARELDTDNLPEYARNWNNIHLQYTHGFGVVMTPAAQAGDESMTWFIRDIPPTSEYGFSVQHPQVYFGIEDTGFVIAPNDLGEIDHPQEGKEVLTDYAGTGGILLSGFFRKLLFAAYFKDRNIFFTPNTNGNSRMIFVRNIQQRIRKITPFFILDNDPYLVVTQKGLFWIQDAFTTSRKYPNAEPCSKKYNYIRNAVKVVVDAYNGSVDYYMADSADPIVRAYNRMYPGLIKGMAEMPDELRPHLRYPKDMFEMQMEIYAKYHQTDPELFYRQEDNWQSVKTIRDETTVPMRPYYLTLDLLQPLVHEFLLLQPMSPRAKDNLRSLAIAGCDGDHYGKIAVYSFPKGKLVPGPLQISALIDQDTEISQEMTLWGQAGSKVTRGRTIVIPVSNMLLYIQPVYLSSTTRLKIPELKRLIVSQGEMVAMEDSLESAFDRLEEKMLKNIERKRRRFEVNGYTQPKAVTPAADVSELHAPETGAMPQQNPGHSQPVPATSETE